MSGDSDISLIPFLLGHQADANAAVQEAGAKRELDAQKRAPWYKLAAWIPLRVGGSWESCRNYTG